MGAGRWCVYPEILSKEFTVQRISFDYDICSTYPDPGEFSWAMKNEPRRKYLMKSLKELLHPIQKLTGLKLYLTLILMSMMLQRKCLKEFLKNRKEHNTLWLIINKNPAKMMAFFLRKKVSDFLALPKIPWFHMKIWDWVPVRGRKSITNFY